MLLSFKTYIMLMKVINTIPHAKHPYRNKKKIFIPSQDPFLVPVLFLSVLYCTYVYISIRSFICTSLSHFHPAISPSSPPSLSISHSISLFFSPYIHLYLLSFWRCYWFRHGYSIGCNHYLPVLRDVREDQCRS